MKYQYDRDVDGLYIWFVENIEEERGIYENEVWPKELKEEIGLLFGKNAVLIGLEIMPASKYFEKSRLDSFEQI